MLKQLLPFWRAAHVSVFALLVALSSASGVIWHGYHGGLAGIPIYTAFPIARYNPDGSYDTGFGNQGILASSPLQFGLL
jgi:hypothetical protein